jgi:hypothetical protein
MVFLVVACAAPDGFSFHLGLLKDETQDEKNGDETLELSFAFHGRGFFKEGQLVYMFR